MNPAPGPENWLAEQGRRNLLSRDRWDAFAGHRRRVMSLLLEAAQGRGRASLCLLGAGNCNDLDLPALVNCYGRIELVDCDAVALAAGIERQGLMDHPSLMLRGGIDLLGLPADAAELRPADLIRAVANHQPLIEPGSFDVVGSLCALSQLIEAGANLWGAEHPETTDLIQAIRLRHLQVMAESLQPGGCAILISDLVSSDTAPQLQTLPASQLAAFVADCIARRNFFTGLNPAVILDLLRSDPWFASRIESAEPIGPWKWDQGGQIRAVFAVRFRRRQTQSP